MSTIDSLKRIRDNYLARLEVLSLTDKPSYGVNDKRVDWTPHQQMIIDAIEKLDSLIARKQSAGEVIQRGI